MNRIVVGVDGSPQSVQALLWADRQARLSGAELHAVIAWHLPTAYGYTTVYDDVDWETESSAILDQAITQALGEVDGQRVRRHVVEGHPATALLEAAADADLLVVGSRGHGGFAGLLLGSVSQHTVSHAHCPVVVVHEESRSTSNRDPSGAGVI